MSCPARRTFSTRLEHSRDSTKTCSSQGGEAKTWRLSENCTSLNSVVQETCIFNVRIMDQSVRQEAKCALRHLVTFNYGFHFFNQRMFSTNQIIPCNLLLLLFLPGDTSQVSDRCRHSAACQAGPAVTLSTPSHSLEGSWTHIHIHFDYIKGILILTFVFVGVIPVL